MDIKWDIVLPLPADVTFLKTMAFVASFSLAVFLIALLARFILGKDSGLKFSLAAGLGILMLYAMCVVIYIFSPRDLTQYLNNLPIGTFKTTEAGEQIFVLNSLRNLGLPELCCHLLRIYVLAVLINIMGNVKVEKMKLLGWILLRLFLLGCAIILNYGIMKLIGAFAPFLLEKYAPMILLAILLFSCSMGFLKFIFALLLTAVNPIFGAFYAFFFKNKFGKCLSQAMGSTLLICLMIFVFEYLGYGTIPIHTEALKGYIPFSVSMFVLWVFVGRIL